MKNSKILVRINNIDEIKDYEKKGINSFLFALDEFSIGYPSFKLDDLNDVNNKYLLINRVFDNKALEDFKKIIPSLNSIKGIFFEDLAVYMLLKDTNIPLIWNQMHFVINSRSINYYLNMVSSVCLSNELTRDEINAILDNSQKKVILEAFGRNTVMYSRRMLLSHFSSYTGLNMIKNGILVSDNNNFFIAKETIYGTILFNKEYFNYLNEEFDDEKILLYYVDPGDKTSMDILNILDGKAIKSDNRFLEHETIYKLEARND